MSLSEYFKTLPAPVQRSSLAVKGLQRQRAIIQHEYNMACIALEKQFLGKQEELNLRRFAIISGDRPTPSELSAGAEDTTKVAKDYKSPSLIANNTAPITDFWLTVIRNHVELDTMIKEQDVPALHSLADIQFSFLYSSGPKPDFTLKFKFEANDFFTNDILEKTYYFKEEPDRFGDFEHNRSVGTNIKWKRGKKLTKNSDGESSFFDFFTPPVPPQKSNRIQHKDNDDGEYDDEAFEVYEEELEEDFTRGKTFKEEIIPDAIDYFMQEKEEDENNSEWDSDVESGDDDNDGDDEDVPDSDYDAPVKVKHPGRR